MKAVSGREFARILEARGWILIRVSGSHHIYARPGVPARITLPIHSNRSLRPGLQRHLMKNAGLTDDDL